MSEWILSLVSVWISCLVCNFAFVLSVHVCFLSVRVCACVDFVFGVCVIFRWVCLWICVLCVSVDFVFGVCACVRCVCVCVRVDFVLGVS